MPDLIISATIPSTALNTGLIVTGGSTAANYSQYKYNVSAGIIAQNVSTVTSQQINSNYTTGYTISTVQSTSVIALHNSANQEVVRLNKDGSVTWAKEIDIDAAAEAFAKSIQIGGERSVGITQGVKQRMRDTIFKEMIELAKIKGTLNADDLTYMLSAAKIMDKLKGGNE